MKDSILPAVKMFSAFPERRVTVASPSIFAKQASRMCASISSGSNRFFSSAVHRGKTAGCHDLAFSAGMISTARHGKICFAVMQNISDRDNFPIFPLYHLLVCLYFHQTHLNHGFLLEIIIGYLISKDNSVIKTISLYKNLKNKAITIWHFWYYNLIIK